MNDRKLKMKDQGNLKIVAMRNHFLRKKISAL